MSLGSFELEVRYRREERGVRQESLGVPPSRERIVPRRIPSKSDSGERSRVSKVLTRQVGGWDRDVGGEVWGREDDKELK